MKHFLFSERMYIDQEFSAWCKEHNAVYNIANFLAMMQGTDDLAKYTYLPKIVISKNDYGLKEKIIKILGSHLCYEVSETDHSWNNGALFDNQFSEIADEIIYQFSSKQNNGEM